MPKASSNCTVIVPEATPAVSVWAAVVKTSLPAAAAMTVSCCVAEVRPPAAAVSVGVPAAVSLYVKLAVLPPARNRDARDLRRAAIERAGGGSRREVDGLAARAGDDRVAEASSNCTVIVPEATPAVSVCAAVVKTSLLAAAALTVSCCVAAVRPAAAAVRVGVPAAVSL